jgi:autophagy-related protein 18
MASVLNILINRKRLVIVLEDRIHIYDVTNMKLLHTIDVPPNTSRVAALTPNSDLSLLAYPSNTSTGELTIFDCINLKPLSIIKAHKTPVTSLTFSAAGDMLATASDKVSP